MKIRSICTPIAEVLSVRGVKSVIFVVLAIPAVINVANAQVAPSLGEGLKFAVLGGSTITNTGSSVLTGDLGLNPGTSITGFPPGSTHRSVSHIADQLAAQAQTDAASAYAALAAQTCTMSYSVPTDIGGMTLTPGVYCFSSSAQLTGALTLDGGGNPNAVWVFNIGSTLTTASASSVTLINSAQQHNVFWGVGSSATLGTGSTFQGNILASASITLTTNVTLSGRALALNGAVTLDTDVVSLCVCDLPYNAIQATVTDTLTVAPAVGGVAGSVFGATLSPSGQSLWVAGYNGVATPGFVSLVNVASHQITGTVPVGAGPADIGFSAGGGRAFITNYSGNSLSVVAVPSLHIKQTIDLTGLPMTSPFGVVAEGANLLVTTQGMANQGTGNSLAEFSTTSPLVLRPAIAMSGQSGRPAVIPANATHYANHFLVPVFVPGTGINNGHPTLVVVNPRNQQTAKITLPGSHATPMAVVVSPDGTTAYVSLFNTAGGTDGVWVVSLASLATVTVIQTCDPENYGEAISADGKYLLVAGFLENQVAVIDTATDTVDLVIPGGHHPNAIAITRDGSQAFFTNQTDGTVKVISFTPSL